ncbi:ubiquitin fusion degradation protein [Coemansia sp. IMI 203386]|nr:ubiquitin fusion degradation protein [Coemansia sp. IMI 203386]
MANDSDDGYGFGFGGFQPPGAFNIRRNVRRQQFREHYSAYPIGFLANKEDANYGGKIFMPPSALEEISQREVVYPLLFKIQTEDNASSAISTDGGASKRTHCGVLEFTAEEGRVYLPQWMMDTLGISPGTVVEVINVALLRGSLTKLQPQSVDFLDISDHRAVLENELRKFSALTVGDVIAFKYNEKEYRIKVVETQPSPTAINIVETDLSVDFAPPVGYVEPTRPGTGVDSRASNYSSATGGDGRSSIAKDIKRREEAAKDELASSRFAAFRGSGNRLSSKSMANASGGIEGSGRPASVRSYASNVAESKVPDSAEDDGDEQPVPLDLPIGTLFFGYKLRPPPGAEDQQANDGDNGGDEAKFQGSGRVLRQRRKR